MARSPEFGLLIDYEYCTGCHTCQVACAQEYGWPAGMGGIRVRNVQQLPNDKAYLTYLPFPTELCILCKPRTKKGLAPAVSNTACGVHAIWPDRGAGQGNEEKASHGALGA